VLGKDELYQPVRLPNRKVEAKVYGLTGDSSRPSLLTGKREMNDDEARKLAEKISETWKGTEASQIAHKLIELLDRQRWIPCNERLPEPLRSNDLIHYAPYYLVIVNDGPRSMTDNRILHPVKRMKFIGWEFFGGWEYDSVTHWQKQPQPPGQP